MGRKKKPIDWPVLPDDAEILAIDPSLHSSGWCRLRVDKSVIDCGTVKVPAKYTGVACVSELARGVAHLTPRIDPCIAPELIAIEEQYTPTKGRMSGPLRTAQASGVWVALLTLDDKSLSVVEAYPQTWQSYMGLSGKREARKAAMIAFAKSYAPWLAWEEDSADALGIGLYASAMIQKARGEQ